MSTTNGNGTGNGADSRANEPKSGGNPPPEYLIAKTLTQKLETDKLLRSGDRQDVAYRIAEIMVAAKDLYTLSLPRLLGEGESLAFYDELAGLRMTLLHMRDLVTEFDSAFLDAMLHEREGQSTESEWLSPDNWEPEELGEVQDENYDKEDDND